MKKTLIPMDNSIESIRVRERIIRDFYREWKFESILIMVYDLAYIGKVKMTVGVRRRTKEKVQYCITAISNE